MQTPGCFRDFAVVEPPSRDDRSKCGRQPTCRYQKPHSSPTKSEVVLQEPQLSALASSSGFLKRSPKLYVQDTCEAPNCRHRRAGGTCARLVVVMFYRTSQLA